MAGLASLAVSAHGTALAEQAGPWGPIAKLRDDTNRFPTGKPAGGWYVAPIHATLRASDGKILISGFGRKGESNCTSGHGGTAREQGESFVFNPADIDAMSDGDTLSVQSIDEQAVDPVHHVLYCSGQITLADGRILYVGGTDYPSILPEAFPEFGLNYARIFDPKTNAFTRIKTLMGGGQAETPGMKWYPTNLRMPDGRVLTVGGFHWSAGGPGSRSNRSLEMFDPKIWDADHEANPFTVLTQQTDVPTDYHAGGRGYVNLFLLPRPVPAAQGGDLARSVALAGNVAQIRLFNAEVGPTGAQRLFTPTNAQSPNPSSFEKGEGSSGVMLPDGKLMFVDGGHDGMGAQRAYFYDPYADSWTTLDTGISRIYPTAVWLPNGTVLVVNGYTSEPSSTNDVANPMGGPDGVRKPQIIDPFARTVTTEAAWPEPTGRGYHNFALLLKDGRILIGGGKDENHDTACEKNELRIYSPPYLSAGPRPAITNVPDGQALAIGATLTVKYTGTVREARGVVLVAPGSVTHSFNQGQRYVPLTMMSAPSNGSLSVALPATVNEAPPGDYILHAISDLGVPSVGVHVRLSTAEACANAGNCVVGMIPGGTDAGFAADANVEVGTGATADGSPDDVPASADAGSKGNETNPPSSGESGCSCALYRQRVSTTPGLIAAGLAIAWAASRRGMKRRSRTWSFCKHGRSSSGCSRP